MPWVTTEPFKEASAYKLRSGHPGGRPGNITRHNTPKHLAEKKWLAAGVPVNPLRPVKKIPCLIIPYGHITKRRFLRRLLPTVSCTIPRIWLDACAIHEGSVGQGLRSGRSCQIQWNLDPESMWVVVKIMVNFWDP